MQFKYLCLVLLSVLLGAGCASYLRVPIVLGPGESWSDNLWNQLSPISSRVTVSVTAWTFEDGALDNGGKPLFVTTDGSGRVVAVDENGRVVRRASPVGAASRPFTVSTLRDAESWVVSPWELRSWLSPSRRLHQH